MTIAASQVALSTTPANLVPYLGSISGIGNLIFYATGDCFIGPDNTVTSGNGYKVLTGEKFEVDLALHEEVWAVLASGTATAYVLRSDR